MGSHVPWSNSHPALILLPREWAANPAGTVTNDCPEPNWIPASQNPTQPQSPSMPLAAPPNSAAQPAPPNDVGGYRRLSNEGPHSESRGKRTPFAREEKHPAQSCAFQLYSFPNNHISTGFGASGAEGRTAAFIFLTWYEGVRRWKRSPKLPRDVREVSIYAPNLIILLYPVLVARKFP